jgi:hypothetical protein
VNGDMGYDPSHRTPPRQDRWPNATPQQGWPAYSGRGESLQTASHRNAYGGYGGVADGHEGGAGYGYHPNGNGYAPNGNGHSGVPAGYGGNWDGGNWDGGYGDRGGYPAAAGYFYPGTAGDFYPGTAGDFYPGAPGDFYQGVAGDFAGSDPRTGYLDQGRYLEPLPSGALLIAPDTPGQREWVPRRSRARGRDAGRGGLIVGAVTGFLAAAVAIGAAILAAAFVRPQASPVIAVGGALIDRTPSAVKNFAVEHFGENDKTMLLLGMYAAIAVLAMVIGCLARRNPAIGVGGIAAFGLLGAFVAITRPESQPTDVIPSVIGGLAGIAAFAWLAHASAPVAAVRPAHGGGRRRAR